MLIMPSFQKSLIVEQFQGNYLKSTLDGFLLQMLLRSLSEYVLKQLFSSISVNSGRIFTSLLRGSVYILPLFTSISKNNC